VPFLPKIVRYDEFDNSPEIWAGIICVLLVKATGGVFAFPICAILITQGSPSRELLGTVNGASQALGSLCRAIGPAIAGAMYSRSLEVSKPWIVWRYGLGIFAMVVWIGGWFLSDQVRLPDSRSYIPVVYGEQVDTEEEIEQEEDRLWREEEDGIIDTGRVISPNRQCAAEGSKIRVYEDSEGSSDDEFVQGVSKHLLSGEH
jgi:MFS family permease